ncbi:MAG: S8 family serine peptidase [Candidatus Thorarchaeota archaeon]
MISPPAEQTSSLALPEERLQASSLNWSKGNDSVQTQAIFLFRNWFPSHLPGVRVLHRYKLHPAVLVEGTIEQLRQIACNERANLIAVSENQRMDSLLSPLPSQIGSAGFSPSQTMGIRDIIGATRLHQLGYDGTGIRIGIIDTGVNVDHPDFEGRVIAAESFVRKEYGYSADVNNATDENGHGTWVAGVAAGKEFGIAPKAEIISAKIFGNSSVTGNGNIPLEETTAAIIAAIEYCVEQGADVINFSIGQYHNLPWDLRQYWINKVSLEKEIVFVASAGNSGKNGIDGGTLNNPGTALQAITVAAAIDSHTLAGFSSTGPKPDYSMKPDITAPGISLWGPDKNGDYTTKSGTSAAAPLVTGAAALLLHYATSLGNEASPGTIKAALMSGAIPMETEGKTYPAWRQGAGFLNASKAHKILANSKTAGIFDLIYIHPHKLPFEPFSTLFKDQKWTFNLTVIASGSTNVSFLIPATNLRIKLPPMAEVRDSQLVPITFYAPDSAEEKPVSAIVNVTSSNGAKTEFIIEGRIKKALFSILLDEAHQIITRQPGNTGSSLHYGDNSNIYGAFRDWVVLMESCQVAVTPFTGPELNSSVLEDHDLFVMLNAFSYNYDIFTDWIGVENQSYVAFSPNETQNLREWVDTGGNLLVITRGNFTVYIPALNDFLSPYDVTVDFTELPLTWNYEFAAPISVPGVYAGPTLSSGSNNAILARKSANANLVIGHERPSGSRVLVLGSDYSFDNYAFNGEYGPAGEQNQQFVLDILSWVLNTSFPEVSIPSTPDSPMSSKTRHSDALLPIIPLLAAIAFMTWLRRRKKSIGK